MSKNIRPVFSEMLSQADKEKLLQQHARCIWFTGLSGSGKSTLALALERELYNSQFKTAILDGDNIRSGINSDLGFSENERYENIRRIAEINKLFIQNGIITINAFISPTTPMRQLVCDKVGKENFILIYTQASLEICESRDTKGFYKKARLGEMNDFTGISSSFEEPSNAHLVLDTGIKSIQDCLTELMLHILPLIKIEE